jgi:hypothetical protein
VIQPNPVTLQLRYLQALNDISGNQASTIIFPLPIDMLGPLLGRGSQAQAPPAEGEEQQPAERALPLPTESELGELAERDAEEDLAPGQPARLDARRES